MTVYFIQEENDGLVKVGFTRGNATKRLTALQTANGRRLHLVSQFGENEEYEKYLHAIFDPYRERGEWFRPEGRFRNYLDMVALPMNRVGIGKEKKRDPNLGAFSKLTAKQWEQMEKLILSPRAHKLSLGRIAGRFRVSTALVNLRFPGWRKKTPKERKLWRAENPLPTR